MNNIDSMKKKIFNQDVYKIYIKLFFLFSFGFYTHENKKKNLPICLEDNFILKYKKSKHNFFYQVFNNKKVLKQVFVN